MIKKRITQNSKKKAILIQKLLIHEYKQTLTKMLVLLSIA